MNKNEFLNLLKQSLEGEVDRRIIEQNIDYYNEYISSHFDKSEEDAIAEIGDPRLIAKTIIDTEKFSYKELNSQSNYDQNSHSGNYNNYRERDESRRSPNKVYHLNWYSMVIIGIIIVFLFILLIRIGWLLLRLLSVFFLPIILIGLLLSLFKKR